MPLHNKRRPLRRGAFAPAFAHLYEVQLASNYGPTHYREFFGAPCIDFDKSPRFNSMLPKDITGEEYGENEEELRQRVGYLRDTLEFEEERHERVRRFAQHLSKKMFLMGRMSPSEMNAAVALGVDVDLEGFGYVPIRRGSDPTLEVNGQTQTSNTSVVQSDVSSGLDSMYNYQAEIIHACNTESLVLLHKRNAAKSIDSEESTLQGEGNPIGLCYRISNESLPPSISQADINAQPTEEDTCGYDSGFLSSEPSGDTGLCRSSTSGFDNDTSEHETRRRPRFDLVDRTFSKLMRALERQANTYDEEVDLTTYRPFSSRIEDMAHYDARLCRLEESNKTLRSELQSALDSARELSAMAAFVSGQHQNQQQNRSQSGAGEMFFPSNEAELHPAELVSPLDSQPPPKVSPRQVPSAPRAVPITSYQRPIRRRADQLVVSPFQRPLTSATAPREALTPSKKPSVSQIPRPLTAVQNHLCARGDNFEHFTGAPGNNGRHRATADVDKSCKLRK